MNSFNFQKKSLKIINSYLIKIVPDIGGSLTKLSVALHSVSASEDMRKKFLHEYGFLEEIELDQNFIYIINFHTSNFNFETLDFLKQIKSQGHFNHIYATGVGAYKFYEIIDKEFGIKLEKQDQLLSLVKGDLMMSHYQTFNELTGNGGDSRIISSDDIEFPYLSVNVDSGVSMQKNFKKI